MDVCQLKPDSDIAHWVPISRDRFESATRRKYPWYRRLAEPIRPNAVVCDGASGTDKKAGQYAVCTNCNNPVQIVGLYSNSIRPYGRHLSHMLPDIADYDQVERDQCFYYKPLGLRDSDRRAVIGRQTQIALKILIDNFDHVVALLKQDTGILFSEKLLGGMLERFKAERGYLYPGTTVLNIPWMFAYFSDSNSLWWQYCRDRSGLPNEISTALPHVQRETGGDSQSPTTRFIPRSNVRSTQGWEEMAFHFTKHRRPTTGEGRENMTMVISHGDGSNDRDIAFRLIEFNFEKFQNLTQIGARRNNLLALAREKLGDLLCDV